MTRSSSPLPSRSADTICAGSSPVASVPTRLNCPSRYANNETALSGRVHAGQQGALVGDDRGDVARRVAGIDRDRRLEAPRLVRHALPKEDVTRSVDDGHVGHAVAVQVGHEGRVPRNEADRIGLGELPVPLVQLDRDAVGILQTDGQVEFSVPGEVARCDHDRGSPASQIERRQELEPAHAVTLGARRPASEVGIGDRQVERAAAEEVAAMIEVGFSPVPSGIGGRTIERALALAQKDRNDDPARRSRRSRRPGRARRRP